MNICAHNVMNGLRKWIMESDWNTFRIHISHTDMDGCACHILTRYATNLMNPNSKSMMIQWSSNAGMETIKSSIMKTIDRLESNSKYEKRKYVKGKKKLFFLITDLGQFDPSFFNQLIADGHKINYILIDHHEIDENLAKIELDGNTEEFQMAHNCYYVDNTYCAAKSVGNAIRAILTQYRPASMLSPTEFNRYYSALEHISSYLDKVDKYDRGQWGKWAGLDVEEVDGSVKEQLFFKSFRSEDRGKYITLMVNYFQTIRAGLDIPKSEQPFWYVDMNNFNTRYYNAIRPQLVELNESLEKFKAEMHPKTIEFEIPDSIPNPDNLNIQEVIFPSNSDYHSFSFHAKEIMESDPTIDIIILVSMKYRTVELRTAKDNINLSTIAKANGGGGHPKASGFPFSDKIASVMDSKENA